MEKETTGTVIAAKKQWWLKVNTKPFRTHALDGAIFPYIITAAYSVDGVSYTRKKRIRAGRPVPPTGSTVRILYDDRKPEKAWVELISEPD